MARFLDIDSASVVLRRVLDVDLAGDASMGKRMVYPQTQFRMTQGECRYAVFSILLERLLIKEKSQPTNAMRSILECL